jgi:hypothetical protein
MDGTGASWLPSDIEHLASESADRDQRFAIHCRRFTADREDERADVLSAHGMTVAVRRWTTFKAQPKSAEE